MSTPRVLHGDAFDLVPTLGAFDLVITDPPYSVGGKRREWRATSSVFLALRAAARSVAGGGAMVCFSGTSGRSQAFVHGAIKPILPLVRSLVWHKVFTNSPSEGAWRYDTVLVHLYGAQPGGGGFSRNRQSSLLSTPGSSTPQRRGLSDHPAEVQPEVAEWVLSPFDTGKPLRVLDPFCGTGALLLPAAERGWPVVGIDNQEKWVKYAEAKLARPRPQTRLAASEVRGCQ